MNTQNHAVLTFGSGSMVPMRCEWVRLRPLPTTSTTLPPTQVDTLVKLNVSANVENRILLVHPIVYSEY
jgi:hypothetical protein